jgi:hypothetical protein
MLVMADGWHYTRDGKTFGPFSRARLQQLAAEGKLRRTDLFWKDGMREWKRPEDIKGLFSPFVEPSWLGTPSTRRAFLLGTACGLGLGVALGVTAPWKRIGKADGQEDEEAGNEGGEPDRGESPATPVAPQAGGPSHLLHQPGAPQGAWFKAR